MFLPGLTVAIALCPVVIRSLRASMLNVLGADFVTTARAKGVPGRAAVRPARAAQRRHPRRHRARHQHRLPDRRHADHREGIPIPGIGQLMINSIFERDFPVVQGVALVFGIMVVLVNLLTDVAYAPLDPRVRFDR